MTEKELIRRLLEELDRLGPAGAPLRAWVGAKMSLVELAARTVVASVPPPSSEPSGMSGVEARAYLRRTVNDMLGRGAPRLVDDLGFNREDYAWADRAFDLLTSGKASIRDWEEAARRLRKYANTQLGGPEELNLAVEALKQERRAAVAGVADAVARGNGTWMDGEAAVIYRPGVFRNDRGEPAKADEVLVRIPLFLSPKKTLEALGIRPRWFVVREQGDNVFFARLSFEEAGKLAEALDAKPAGEALAAALRASVPLWEAQAATAALPPAPTADGPTRGAAATAAAPLGVSAEVEAELDRVVPQLLRMADAERREDPGYEGEVRQALRHELMHGLKPGMGEWDGAEGALKLEPKQRSMLLAVDYAHREWWRSPIRVPEPQKVKGFNGRWWHRVSIKAAKRIARALDAYPRLRGLAATLRYLVLVDREERKAQDVPEVVFFANARRFSDLPAHMQAKARDLGSKIPVGPDVELAEYQQLGVLFAAMRGYRALIADAPGVGKTAQAIGALSFGGPAMLPAVVSCPASVVYNWQAEIRKFAPWLDPVVVEASSAMPAARPNTVYIVSTASLARVVPGLLSQKPATFIFDEADAAKSRQKKLSQRADAALALSQAVDHVLLLTGTPLRNEVAELWSLLFMIAPNDFPDFDEFVEKWGGQQRKVAKTIVVNGVEYPIELDGDADASSADLDRNEALADALQAYMIRRRYSEVEDQVAGVRGPTRVRVRVTVPLTPAMRRAYEAAEEEIADLAAADFARRFYEHAIGKLRSFKRAIARKAMTVEQAATLAFEDAQHKIGEETGGALSLVKLGKLRQIAGEAKAPAAAQWLFQHFQQSSEPVVVFAEHKPVIARITKALEDMRLRFAVIDGSTGQKQRFERVDAFQKGQLDVIVLSRAASTGITLTRSHIMLMVERQWVPAEEEQIEGRIARRGQTRQPKILYFMAPDTVDDHIAELVDKKRQLSEIVVGEGEAAGHDRDRQDANAIAQAQMADIEAAIRARLAQGRRVQTPTFQSFERLVLDLANRGELWEGPIKPNPSRRVR